jgi:hypothetical protein
MGGECVERQEDSRVLGPMMIAARKLAMTRGAMTGLGRHDRPSRHCEARSAVAIHVPVPRPQWIASFLAMTEQGRNDRLGAQTRALRHFDGRASRSAGNPQRQAAAPATYNRPCVPA